jgi:hypothetical protein
VGHIELRRLRRLAKYHQFKVKAGFVDVNDKQWTGRQAEDLEKTLSRLAMDIPSLVEMVKEPPYGDVLYNVTGGPSSTALLNYPCGHKYVAAPANWFQPRCEVCGKAMEKQAEADPGTWQTRDIEAPKSTVLEKIGMKLKAKEAK